jgi:hypothetical protein
MTLTIETNKRSFINALIAICKTAGVTYKVEDTPKYNAKILAAVERHKSGNTEGSILFTDMDEMYRHFGMEPEK